MRNLSDIVKFSTKLDFIILFMCNFIHLPNRKDVIPLGLRAMPGSALTSTKCIIYLIQAQKLHLNCIIEPAGIRVIHVRFFHSCHSEALADHRPSSPPQRGCQSLHNIVQPFLILCIYSHMCLRVYFSTICSKCCKIQQQPSKAHQPPSTRLV